jgi:hypothetical protein
VENPSLNELTALQEWLRLSNIAPGYRANHVVVVLFLSTHTVNVPVVVADSRVDSNLHPPFAPDIHFDCDDRKRDRVVVAATQLSFPVNSTSLLVFLNLYFLFNHPGNFALVEIDLTAINGHA